MKNFLFLSSSVLLIFALIYSCSSETEDTSTLPAVTKPKESEPDPTKYTLTVTAGDGGTVSTEGGAYDEGTEINVIATPNEGYEFVRWEGIQSFSGNNIKVSVNTNISLEAVFKKTNLSLIVSLIEGPSDKVVTGFQLTGLIPFDDNNIFFNPTDFFTYPTYPMLHLKRDSIWKLNKIYDDMHFQVIRDFKILDEKNFVVADQGLEIGQEDRSAAVDLGILDMGETYHLNFENDVLTRNKLSPTRAFYHSIDAGDLDGDNKNDIVSMYMALPAGVDDNNKGTRMYMFSESGEGNSNFIETTGKIKTLDWESTNIGAILIDEFTGDNQLDLIRFTYKPATGFEINEDFLYSYELLTYNANTEKIERIIRKSRFSEIPLNYGVAWSRATDYDSDSDKDLIVFIEENTGLCNIQLWNNDGSGNFEYDTEILSSEQIGFNTRDFEVYDFDNDGDLDLFLHPFGTVEYPINFSEYIYENNNGVFSKYQNEVIYDDEIVNLYYMRLHVVDGKPHYLGIEKMPEGTIKLFDFKLNLE